MDPNAFDISGIATTLIIFAVVAMIVSASRYFNEKNPELVEKITGATPWMGWVEDETETRQPRQPYTFDYKI